MSQLPNESPAAAARKEGIPEGLWMRCPECEEMLFRKVVEEALYVCPSCQHHFRISARQRIDQLVDPGSFEEMFTDVEPTDPIGFVDKKSYADRLKAEQKKKRKTVVACWSEGSRDRMAQLLQDHGLEHPRLAENWHDAETTSSEVTAIVVLGLETGFQTDGMLVLAEQDILGERLLRPKRRKKASEALTEAASLAAGDLVVHVDHGIGRFLGLKTIEVSGAPHDCVEIEYAQNTKLYLPVENIELLTRYGADGGVELDKLGGVAWQAKKSRLKKRIREMADQLIKIAAQRQLTTVEPIEIQSGLYEEFAARFPYEETEDQLVAIDAIFGDLSSGRVMDRLVCGDVGFGKTEVALRAAFAVAMSGRQVAVVVPTTLLARQHFKTFRERFSGLPLRVAQASRLVGAGRSPTGPRQA